MSDIRKVAVIMAGGSGERFWPLSRERHPKQLLRLTRPDMSLLQEAVDRLGGVVDPSDIHVVTGRHLREAILSEGGLGIPAENVLAEPCKRNTAGCLCYAAAVLAERYAEIDPGLLAMAVLTADHCIGDADGFRRCVTAALGAAVAHRALATVGIRPTRAETGYGYIEYRSAEPLPGGEPGMPVFPVVRFLEKPDLELAERFVRSGNFLWNSGMFFWSLETFLGELGHAQPEMRETVDTMRRAIREGDGPSLDAAFAGLPSISIDYALMEAARDVLVIPAAFPWDDIGAWDALERTFELDAGGNATYGDPVVIDTAGSIVYNGSKGRRMAVATVGLRDLVVVVSDDAVLVVPKSRAQDVKQVVAKLRERGADQL